MPEIWTLFLWPFIFHRHLQVITLSSLLFLSATLKLIGSSISTMLKTSLSTNRYFTLKTSLSFLLNINYYFLIALQLLKNIDGTNNHQSGNHIRRRNGSVHSCFLIHTVLFKAQIFNKETA
jgi:hypothetical protein